MNDPEDFKCPNCGEKKGEIIWIHGLAVLDQAGELVRSLNAQCKKCGSELHFHTNDILLKHLVSDMLKSRQSSVK